MADAGDDLFLFGDDLEEILDLLNEDEPLQEQFSTVASEVSANYTKHSPVLSLFPKELRSCTRLCCHASQKTVNKSLIRRF